MNMKDITPEVMQTAYKEYLAKAMPYKADDVLLYTEHELLDFIQNYVNPDCSNIYDIRDHKLCDNTRSQMQTIPAWRKQNELTGNNLSQALKHYANFLQSKYYTNLVSPKKSGKHSPVLSGKPKAAKELPLLKEMTEGSKTHAEYERRYRNPQLRKQCIAEYGWVCQVCGFDFSKAYGEELGANFIEVHHLEPISGYEEEHPVDPIKDLVPLCSNCHSMIHHGKEGPLSLKKMREIYQGIRWEIPKLKSDE